MQRRHSRRIPKHLKWRILLGRCAYWDTGSEALPIGFSVRVSLAFLIYRLWKVCLLSLWLWAPSKMSDPWNRIASDNNCYPTVAELLNSPNSDLTSFLSMAKKATLECLLRETLSQLNDTKKQNEQLITCLDENKRCLQQLQNSVTEIGKTSPKITWDIWTCSLGWRSEEVPWWKRLWQSGIRNRCVLQCCWLSDDIPITQQLDPFLQTPEIPSSIVKCAKRLGERKAGKKTVLCAL